MGLGMVVVLVTGYFWCSDYCCFWGVPFLLDDFCVGETVFLVEVHIEEYHQKCALFLCHSTAP